MRRAHFDLFIRTKFIRIYGMVTQLQSFKSMQKCTHAYGGWSIFTEKCTPDVITTSIKKPYTYKCILLSKMERANTVQCR